MFNAYRRLVQYISLPGQATSPCPLGQTDLWRVVLSRHQGGLATHLSPVHLNAVDFVYATCADCFWPLQNSRYRFVRSLSPDRLTHLIEGNPFTGPSSPSSGDIGSGAAALSDANDQHGGRSNFVMAKTPVSINSLAPDLTDEEVSSYVCSLVPGHRVRLNNRFLGTLRRHFAPIPGCPGYYVFLPTAIDTIFPFYPKADGRKRLNSQSATAKERLMKIPASDLPDMTLSHNYMNSSRSLEDSSVPGQQTTFTRSNKPSVRKTRIVESCATEEDENSDEVDRFMKERETVRVFVHV
ncbi:unnamed protein product [Protopolystoma xenopodis]|uniref:Uncharacterized protein n=1 Tax=Protopolystoma xenopodis TaxID=117903 RepID=A0A448X7X8_9PLAT|nr:unnamed protein product [Protopolystoma xenopodis]